MSEENLFDVKSCEQFFGESRFIIQSYLIAAFISDNGLLNILWLFLNLNFLIWLTFCYSFFFYFEMTEPGQATERNKYLKKRFRKFREFTDMYSKKALELYLKNASSLFCNAF